MRTLCSSPLRAVVLPAFLVLALSGCKGGGEAAKPGVVATYAGGEITVEGLRKVLDERLNGLKALVGDKAAPLDEQIPKDKELYRALVEDMVLDELVKRRIREKQLDNRGNIRHALDHVEEEVTLQELHGEIHEKDKIPLTEVEIQDYYEKNRSRFGEKPLYEVRAEIKTVLEAEKESDYMATYLKELKEVAAVTRDYEILRVPEPAAEEMREYYDRNRELFKNPESWVIDQLDFGEARAEAEKAWARLGSGEDFELFAGPLKKDGRYTTVQLTPGSRGDAFEKAVASLDPGEYSKPIEEGGKYFVVRLKEKIGASYTSLKDAKEEVSRAVKEERREKVYEENKNKTLFTLHGRRFTLDDFYREFKEMRPAEREKYSSFEGQCKLVDRMIDRLLLLEDSYDRMLQAKNREAVEHIREDVLKDELHREEVDRKIEVSDGEVEKVYSENREAFKTPERAMVSIILVRNGEGEAEEKKAREKVQEAYDKLAPGFFRKGMAFEDVAREYSEDPQTAQDGGKLNAWIGETGNPLEEMFNHGLHEQVMHLGKGEISKPFRIGEDHLIIQVREKEQPRQQSLEEVKEYLKQALAAKKHRELTTNMYSEMMREANLTINEKALASMVEEQRKEKEAKKSR